MMYVHSLTVDSERVYNMSGKLNHFDQHGNAVMVDVTDKNVTEREAVATGKIFVCDETYERILTGNMAKGDVLAVARVAGIMATKKTSELIPMCHPLMLTKAKVDFEFNEEEKSRSATRSTNKNRAVHKGQPASRSVERWCRPQRWAAVRG